MRKPRPNRLLLAVCLLLLLACGIGFLAWRQPNRLGPSQLVLPDGSKICLAGVSFGTNHTFGSWLGRWVARTPPALQAATVRFLGSRAVARTTFRTPAPVLVVGLFSRPVPSPAPGGFGGTYEAYLEDTHGFASGGGCIFYPTAGFSQLQFSAFPRRDRILAVHFYHHGSKGTTECGTLKLLNPAYRSYPQWQPEALPATRRVGDLEVTLERFKTGLGAGSRFSWLAGGGQTVEYGTNREDGRNYSAIRLNPRSLTDTSQRWMLVRVEVSDATGNAIQSMGMSWSGSGKDGLFQFNPGLWPNESAWKLRCELKRTEGFSTNELFTFGNVPLPELSDTTRLDWNIHVNGVAITLDHLTRRPPNTNNSWSSGQLTEVSFRFAALSNDHFAGLSNDLHLDLLETRADDGTKVDSPSSHSGGGMQSYGLKNVPPEAKSLTFTMAIHQGHWVEFLVKPETGPARFEYPASRK